MRTDGVAGITRARYVLVQLLTVIVAVLALSGVYLFLAYRPSATQAWGMLPSDGNHGTGFPEVTRTLHRWAGVLAGAVGLAVAVTCVVEAVQRWHGPFRWRSGAITGPAIALVVTVGLLSGFLLPWDQLALRAITVGTDFRGYRSLWGDQVRFALMGGREVSVADLRRWVVFHAGIVPLVLVPLLVLAERTRRAPRTT